MASTYSPYQILTFLFDDMAYILYAVSSVDSLSMKMHDAFLLCDSFCFVSPLPSVLLLLLPMSLMIQILLSISLIFLLAFFISPKALLKKYIPLPFLYYCSLFPGPSFSDYLQHFIVKCIITEILKFD